VTSAIPLRRRAVVWLLLPAVLLLVSVNNASQTGSPLAGFWTWTVAHSVLLFIVPAALAATGAALEASRLRARRVENATNIRGPWVTLANAIWPSYLGGLLVQGVAIALVATSAWGGDSAIPFGLLLSIASVLLFHTTLGFLMGSVMRPVIGVPVALALSYSWLGFTGTIEWFAPRHLAGLVLETCCFYDEQVNLLSMSAAIVFSTSASVAFCLVSASALGLTAARPIQRIAAPSAFIALAAVGGLLLSGNLSSTATEPRDVSELKCSGGEVTVCLYPEQFATEDPVPQVQRMIQKVADLGVRVPLRVTASRAPAPDDHISFRYVPGMTNDQIAASLASSFQADQWLKCESEPVERTIARQDAGDVMRAWLALQMAGTPMADVQGSELPLFRSLMLATDEDQVAWITAALDSMDDCLVEPPSPPT